MSDRTLDIFLAEKLFGYTTGIDREGDPCLIFGEGFYDFIPGYSSDPADMLKVVEKMRELGRSFALSATLSGSWCAVFSRHPFSPPGMADSMPLAIARAAKAALEAGGK